jgi:hypothetical protein
MEGNSIALGLSINSTAWLHPVDIPAHVDKERWSIVYNNDKK